MVQDVVFNIGGYQSSQSVFWLDLLNPRSKWESSKQLKHFQFFGYWLRDAAVLKNRIVYFESSDDNTTYVLEKGGSGL